MRGQPFGGEPNEASQEWKAKPSDQPDEKAQNPSPSLPAVYNP